MTPALTSSVSDVKAAPDYIIVGGGTAGLVVASRLTENPDVRVLVIEAGAHRKGDPNVDIPGMLTQLYGKDEYDWQFMTKPQTHMNNRQLTVPRGKLLGGSSAINYCAVVYPTNPDFEAWTKLGVSGWDPKDMEPYLRKFQTHYMPTSEAAERLSLHKCVDGELKRDDGPLDICYLEGYENSRKAWMESFEALGMDTPGDPIHGNKLGPFICPSSVHPETMTRAYAASSYYEKVATRPNLQVLTEAIVRRVVFNESSQEAIATGVEILSNDGQVSVLNIKEGGEVILSAGVVKSPQVLELSGIGNEELLRQHNIRPIVSNPHVGENLQDHPFVGMCYEVENDSESMDDLRAPGKIEAAVQQYQTDKSGPLTGTKLAFAYLPLVDGNGQVAPTEVEEIISKHVQSGKDLRDETQQLQYEILQELLADPKGATGEFMLLPAQMNVNPTGVTTMGTIFGPTNPGNYVTLAAILNRPFSRGSTHISSGDPLANPDYDPRYLSHPLDVEILARGFQFLTKIRKCEPMTKILKENGRRLPPTGNFDDLEAAKAAIRERTCSAFHPCGTCAMGSKERGGVVSDRLLVHGTKNLRVVDASIFPMVPVGNIQAVVYATAERASDIIKQDRTRS